MDAGTQSEINAHVWRTGSYVKAYDHETLLPAEALILARYREAITGRVLDVGCGAGRILSYLLMLGSDAHGVDISATMVEHCRQRFAGVDVRVGDLAHLAASVEGPFDAILMTDNVLDVFDDAQRRRVLADLRRLLKADGRLVFSSHNLDPWAGARHGRLTRVAANLRALPRRSPVAWVRRAPHLLARRRNRARLAPMQYRALDHAVVNDTGLDYRLLHYYIGRADQERQLRELGFAVTEVLETSGATVAPGEKGRSSSLYYVATPTPTGRVDMGRVVLASTP